MAVLIAVSRLAADLETGSPPTLLDVRWELGGPPGAQSYVEGHIPGAVFVDLETELAGPPGAGGRHPLPTASDFEAAMAAKGVGTERRVVVYDARTSVAAARAWWLLRYFGHPDVAVLDGGLDAWRSAGLALTREEPTVTPGTFQARPGGLPVLDAQGAARLAGGAGVLLDARAPERFAGEQEPIDPVAGHIPGARNLPAPAVLAPGGRFLTHAQLREALRDAGVHATQEIGAYCGSGVTATHTVLALEAAGYRAALYPGSWSEWITDPTRPVATGA